ncbi:Conserved_hypothetical protein [Hexamita inflata]|uniref:Serine aminopeptidase S33 domain-containing protein n=1 Tax=Hexamita inflata TaxID=28002 RepID=A0AA86UU75_9EUKA|nr:Conserved hypothetical protein [Hexamita inflata]
MLVKIFVLIMVIIAVTYYQKKQIKYYTNKNEIQKAIQQLRNNSSLQTKVDKIQYQRFKINYDYNVDDYFYYDYISGSDSSKPTVVILPFLGGHSQSNLIRSVVKRFNDQGHSVAVLLQRGSMGTSNHPNQQKFRQVSDYEDIEILLKVLNCKVILIGYSMGAYQLVRYLGLQSKLAQQYVEQAFVSYFLCDQVIPLKIDKQKFNRFGCSIVNHVQQNSQYLINQGFEEQQVQQIIEQKSLYLYDDLVIKKLQNHCSKEDLYQSRNEEINKCLQNINVPCMFVWGKQDALTPTLPVASIKANKNLSYAQVNGDHLDPVANQLICYIALNM